MLVVNTDSPNELAFMSPEELIADLRKSISLTAQGIARAARVWGELERRGYDLSEFRDNIRIYLPLVAAGKLAPEAVVEFMGDGRKLRMFAGLPIHMQRQLIKDGSVPVWDSTKETTITVKLGHLSTKECALAFDTSGCLRTPEAQAQIASRSKPKTERENVKLTIPGFLARRIKAAAAAEGVTVSAYLERNLPLNTSAKPVCAELAL